ERKPETARKFFSMPYSSSRTSGGRVLETNQPTEGHHGLTLTPRGDATASGLEAGRASRFGGAHPVSPQGAAATSASLHEWRAGRAYATDHGSGQRGVSAPGGLQPGGVAEPGPFFCDGSSTDAAGAGGLCSDAQLPETRRGGTEG